MCKDKFTVVELQGQKYEYFSGSQQILQECFPGSL